MRLHRFYIEEKLEGKKELKIFDEDLLHQMKSVFRLEKGDRVVLFDGEGVDYECEIEVLAKKEGVFKIVDEKSAYIPEKKITLFLSLIKKDNFELASRMATEIGVSKIVPVLTERSEKKNIDIERLRRIVKEASEQCGRATLPEVASVESLKLIVESLEDEIFVADFGGAKISTLKLDNFKTFNLFVGPEGGWTDSERELFKSKGAKFISLGETVLRAETAVAVASALILR